MSKADAMQPGQRFGRWTLAGNPFTVRNPRRRVFGVVECDCGAVRIVDLAPVAHGRSASCGCSRLGSHPAAEVARMEAGSRIAR